MARTVRETALASRSARLRFAVVSKPYWRVLEQGLHLGYRRRATGGTWIRAGAAKAGSITRPSSVLPMICRTPTTKQFLISRRPNARREHGAPMSSAWNPKSMRWPRGPTPSRKR